MALYSYKKAPVEKRKEIKAEQRKVLTVANILDSITYKFSNKLSKVRPISVIIPFIFISSGLAILYGQIRPYAVHYLQSKFTDKLDQQIVSLVPESYEEIRARYITDPGIKYFDEILGEDEVNEEMINYRGTFYLTVEKIQLIDAPVTANVNSIDEKIYREALSEGLAHFQGTCLPGKNCNTLVYGHSAAGDYAQNHPEDVVTAFTNLFNLNIGDEIKIKFEENEYTYIVKKIKEVTPQEVDVLNDTKGRTLTLMTCSPPGLNSKRLIIVAAQQ